MNNFSIDYTLLPSGKIKPKAIKIKANNEQLHSIDQFLTDVQKRKKDKKTGGNLLITLGIPVVKKIVEYLTKKKEGKGLTQHEGGFLPLLLAALPYLATIGSLAGGSAAIANAVINKKKADAELEEQKRHNLEMEKKGTGLKKRCKK